MRFRWFIGGTLLGMVVGTMLTLALLVGGLGIAAFMLGIRPGNVHAWRSPRGTTAAVYLVQTEGPEASDAARKAITLYLATADSCVRLPGAENERSAFDGLRTVFTIALMEMWYQSHMRQSLPDTFGTPEPDVPWMSPDAPVPEPDTESLQPIETDRRL